MRIWGKCYKAYFSYCCGVTYWPSTEQSIKRCTCVNKRKYNEIGASGRRYRNITLTCGRGWIRWWWQMRTPAGSRWMLDNYITRCHRRLESVAVPVGEGCQRSENKLQTGEFGLSVTHGWAAQPACKRSAAMVGRTLGQYVAACPRLQLTSHTQPTSTLSRIKCERYIFIKKCVRSFTEVVVLVDYVSAYICIMYMYVAIQQWYHPYFQYTMYSSNKDIIFDCNPLRE